MGHGAPECVSYSSICFGSGHIAESWNRAPHWAPCSVGQGFCFSSASAPPHNSVLPNRLPPPPTALSQALFLANK